MDHDRTLRTCAAASLALVQSPGDKMSEKEPVNDAHGSMFLCLLAHVNTYAISGPPYCMHQQSQPVVEKSSIMFSTFS
jgi:hypothetical protein